MTLRCLSVDDALTNDVLIHSSFDSSTQYAIIERFWCGWNMYFISFSPLLSLPSGIIITIISKYENLIKLPKVSDSWRKRREEGRNKNARKRVNRGKSNKWKCKGLRYSILNKTPREKAKMLRRLRILLGNFSIRKFVFKMLKILFTTRKFLRFWFDFLVSPHFMRLYFSLSKLRFSGECVANLNFKIISNIHHHIFFVATVDPKFWEFYKMKFMLGKQPKSGLKLTPA